jgi:hypothetical protein
MRLFTNRVTNRAGEEVSRSDSDEVLFPGDAAACQSHPSTQRHRPPWSRLSFLGRQQGGPPHHPGLTYCTTLALLSVVPDAGGECDD